jgi:hypothetical protein
MRVHDSLERVVARHVKDRWVSIEHDVYFKRNGWEGDIDALVKHYDEFGSLLWMAAYECKSHDRRAQRERAEEQLHKIGAYLRWCYPGVPVRLVYVSQERVLRVR